MKFPLILALGLTVVVTLACSGCIGGSNTQTYETNWGKVQIDIPQKVSVTGIEGGRQITIMKDGGVSPLVALSISEASSINPSSLGIMGAKVNTVTSNDNHAIYWYLNPAGGFKQYLGYIDHTADKNLLVNFVVTPLYYDTVEGKIVSVFEEEDVLSIIKSFSFVDFKGQITQSTETIPATKDTEKQRQQLIDAIRELEQATLNSLNYNAEQAADSYALLATAAEETPWWSEWPRMALDTINSVNSFIELVTSPEEFFTPDGAKKALKDPTKFAQIMQGVKDSKNIVSAISTFDAFRGIFRDADSYHLTLDAVSKIEDIARQGYTESQDLAATNVKEELLEPSTVDGLVIPLKSEGSAIWVNGLKATETEIETAFDDAVEQIPDPLPENYPIDKTLTYLNDLASEIRQSTVDNKAIGFNVIKDGEVQKKLVTLGMTKANRDAASELFDAWNNKQQVQYESTIYNTGETICSITTRNILKGADPVIEKAKPIINGATETLGYLDAIRFYQEYPTEMAERVVFNPPDPLNALQGYAVGITNDLITETSNLWTISSGTLGYLQHSWTTDPDSLVYSEGFLQDDNDGQSLTVIEAPISVPSNENSDEEYGSKETKTAYTKDGINFISEERLEQNIRNGLANLGEYEKVQVPLDTKVIEVSPE
jgi:hypothetical protein